MPLLKIDQHAVMARLLETLKARGIEESNYRNKHEIISQTWNNWKKRGLPLDFIYPIAIDLGLSVEWFAEGKLSESTLQVNETKKSYSVNSHDDKASELLKHLSMLTPQQIQALLDTARTNAENNANILSHFKEGK